VFAHDDARSLAVTRVDRGADRAGGLFSIPGTCKDLEEPE